MFTSRGPTLRELAVQALSSVEHGYDLLAPKFDRTPFRTPERYLDASARALADLGPFDAGLDLCCGTGAGVEMLRPLCRERVTGVDFSAGMLAEARAAVATGGGDGEDGQGHGKDGRGDGEDGRGPEKGPRVDWVRADARALPFDSAYDLVVSFGAFGHFLPAEWPAVFAGVHRALRPGGLFAFPLGAPPPLNSLLHWAFWGFDGVMRVRNLLWRPPFVMYYRTFRLGAVRDDLERAGFTVRLHPLEEFGRRPDGSPKCRLVAAWKR